MPRRQRTKEEIKNDLYSALVNLVTLPNLPADILSALASYVPLVRGSLDSRGWGCLMVSLEGVVPTTSEQRTALRVCIDLATALQPPREELMAELTENLTALRSELDQKLAEKLAEGQLPDLDSVRLARLIQTD